jgi:hypothetical protein
MLNKCLLSVVSRSNKEIRLEVLNNHEKVSMDGSECMQFFLSFFFCYSPMDCLYQEQEGDKMCSQLGSRREQLGWDGTPAFIPCSPWAK